MQPGGKSGLASYFRLVPKFGPFVIEATRDCFMGRRHVTYSTSGCFVRRSETPLECPMQLNRASGWSGADMEKPEDKLHDGSGGAPAAPQPSVTEMSVRGSPKGGGTAHQVRPLQVGRHPKPRETARRHHGYVKRTA